MRLTITSAPSLSTSGWGGGESSRSHDLKMVVSDFHDDRVSSQAYKKKCNAPIVKTTIKTSPCNCLEYTPHPSELYKIVFCWAARPNKYITHYGATQMQLDTCTWVMGARPKSGNNITR